MKSRLVIYNHLFLLAGGLYRCTDWLRFYLDVERPEVNERSVWNYELCGTMSTIAPRHYSSSSNLVIELHTDSVQTNHTGFRGIFKFIPRCPCTALLTRNAWQSLAYSPLGAIVSPPSVYQRNTLTY